MELFASGSLKALFNSFNRRNTRTNFLSRLRNRARVSTHELDSFSTRTDLEFSNINQVWARVHYVCFERAKLRQTWLVLHLYRGFALYPAMGPLGQMEYQTWTVMGPLGSNGEREREREPGLTKPRGHAGPEPGSSKNRGNWFGQNTGNAFYTIF